MASFTSYINQIPAKHYFVCAEDCSLTVGSKEKEKQMIAEFPKLKPIIRSEMEKNAGIAREEMATIITSSPQERYIDLIENRPKLLNRIPQHQIVSYLGIKPESSEKNFY